MLLEQILLVKTDLLKKLIQSPGSNDQKEVGEHHHVIETCHICMENNLPKSIIWEIFRPFWRGLQKTNLSQIKNTVKEDLGLKIKTTKNKIVHKFETQK